MRLAIVFTAVVVSTTLLLACSFHEYAQTENLTENIDEYRTGCEVDADTLFAGYLQYDANQFYSPGWGDTPEPTHTPGPATDTDISTALLLKTVWENGCQTGRRDTVGADQASLMKLRDQIDVLSKKIDALLTPTPSK